MNILVADSISGPGHKFFNKIQIDALLRTGHNISVVARKGLIKVPEGIQYYEIPEKFYIRQESKNIGAISNLIYEIKKVRFIKKVTKRLNPDAVIFLTYDALSAVFFRVKYPTFLINHVNIDFLYQWYRYTATKLLPNHFVHICLSKRIEEYLNHRMPEKRTAYIPHGIIDEKTSIHNNSDIIYCPVTSSLDESLLREIIYDKDVISYFSENNIQFVIKTKVEFNETAPCIKIINGFIDNEQYYNYVHNSLLIFLPYNSDFNNRVSGVFHEALSYNTPVLTSDISSFREYEDFVTYNFTVRGPQDFISSIKYIKATNCLYKNLEKLDPTSYWKKLISSVQHS